LENRTERGFPQRPHASSSTSSTHKNPDTPPINEAVDTFSEAASTLGEAASTLGEAASTFSEEPI
jgi:hypothetical protein